MTSAQARQLSKVLTIGVVALALIYLLLLAGLGRGTPGGRSGSFEGVPPLVLSETEIELPGLDVYSDVVERPLFSETRRPEPKDVGDEEIVPEPEAVPAVPLNVALTGIIHTPSIRIALVRDNNTGRALNLRENMPLPGDQGGWLVKTIEPRRVVFEDSSNQAETSLDLAIGTGSKVPTPAPRQQRGGQPRQPDPQMVDSSSASPEQDEVAQRAAEIRRRIEERRAQLRREAEQNRQ